MEKRMEKKIENLRKKYPRFVYQGYSYKISNKRNSKKPKKDLEIFFDFKIISNQQFENTSRTVKNIEFKPKIVIKNINNQHYENISRNIEELLKKGGLDNFIFHLGLMEIPTYWKCVCSPIIEIKAGYLNKEQIKWWKDFIINGMGQFFYENQINFRSSNFLNIVSARKVLGRLRRPVFLETNGDPFSPSLRENGSPRFLIPMGEGKDSIVTLELFKKAKKKINCLIVNPTKNHFEILKIAKIKNPTIIERKIDPVLLELRWSQNKKGFLNGHTPVTALISNLAVFCAVLFGYSDVVMSCEKSADEGNTEYLGKIINHQWSKTSEFEKQFRGYIKAYLTKDINYFSFLRPLYEIKIAEIFAHFPEYFPKFLSCNEARKTKSGTKKATGKWCGKCSKCLFIFTILYPFVDEKELLKIFGPAHNASHSDAGGKNLFEKKELLPTMKELIGEKDIKPLECVGTKKECLVAFYLSWKKAKKMELGAPPKWGELGAPHALPVLLEYFEKKILPKVNFTNYE